MDANQNSVPSKTSVNYIELPVNLLYRIPLFSSIALRVGGGPYIAYGISENVSLSSGNTLGYNGHSYNYKNPDYGVNIIAGLLLTKKLMIDAGYSLGLANLAPIQETINNRVLSFSVGYPF